MTHEATAEVIETATHAIHDRIATDAQLAADLKQCYQYLGIDTYDARTHEARLKEETRFYLIQGAQCAFEVGMRLSILKSNMAPAAFAAFVETDLDYTISHAHRQIRLFNTCTRLLHDSRGGIQLSRLKSIDSVKLLTATQIADLNPETGDDGMIGELSLDDIDAMSRADLKAELRRLRQANSRQDSTIKEGREQLGRVRSQLDSYHHSNKSIIRDRCQAAQKQFQQTYTEFTKSMPLNRELDRLELVHLRATIEFFCQTYRMLMDFLYTEYPEVDTISGQDLQDIHRRLDAMPGIPPSNAKDPRVLAALPKQPKE